MRWWICGLLIAMAWPALAADYDDSWLRGSQTIGPAVGPPARLYRIWAGVYGGVQVGEDFHGVDYGDFPGPLIASTISQDSILNELSGALGGMSTLYHENSNSPSYGGFLGYNWQIDDVVFGAELNANRSTLNTAAYSAVNRGYIVTLPSNPLVPYAVSVNTIANGTAHMSDYFTARGRLGWALGNFLPYLVAGVSFAQINSTRYYDVNYLCVSSNCGSGGITPGGNYPFSDATSGKYILGFDAALGIDYMLTPHVFTRGEVEYLQLGQPSNIRINTVSARVGLGLEY
jgi:outer membrane immunogenic protein